MKTRLAKDGRARAERRKRAKEEHEHEAAKHKRRHKKRKPVRHAALAKPHGTAGIALPVAPAAPPAPSPAPAPSVGSPPITLAQARRLLWRAGFGPTPGQAEALVGQPLEQVVFNLTRPSGPATLTGPEPVEEHGDALDPYDVWGDDHCWWLDRMVRSDQPLVERMTFIFHDWFANSNEKVNSQRMMLEQNELFRSMCFGSFHDLFLAVTANPAMLVFLDGISNEKHNPNENYAREMMELFSLGADRGAYTQEDVKEMARVLTGWTAEWSSNEGLHEFEFDTRLHDKTEKTLSAAFATSGNPINGNWDWEDAVRLCVEHPLHASFFVTKLWGYFISSPPDEATLASMQSLYVSSGYSIRAIVEAILLHPDFYAGPELVTPPVVYNAGLLRAIGRPIDTASWAWMSANAGQQLFYPPNVSGWDFASWLDTSTTRARWEMASAVTSKTYANPWPQTGEAKYSETEEPAAALASALSYWGNPLLSSESSECIIRFSEACPVGTSKTKWELSPYRAMRQNALRMLIATSPDLQVS
jgi:Protein of unknown function (DUF1800)